MIDSNYLEFVLHFARHSSKWSDTERSKMSEWAVASAKTFFNAVFCKYWEKTLLINNPRKTCWIYYSLNDLQAYVFWLQAARHAVLEDIAASVGTTSANISAKTSRHVNTLNILNGIVSNILEYQAHCLKLACLFQNCFDSILWKAQCVPACRHNHVHR